MLLENIWMFLMQLTLIIIVGVLVQRMHILNNQIQNAIYVQQLIQIVLNAHKVNVQNAKQNL